MTTAQWIGIGGGTVLLAFIGFAFRQATKVPERQGHDNWQGGGGTGPKGGGAGSSEGIE